MSTLEILPEFCSKLNFIFNDVNYSNKISSICIALIVFLLLAYKSDSALLSIYWIVCGQALKILAKNTQPAVTKIICVLQVEMKTIHIGCQCSIKQLEGVTLALVAHSHGLKQHPSNNLRAERRTVPFSVTAPVVSFANCEPSFGVSQACSTSSMAAALLLLKRSEFLQLGLLF